ncbi:hypothetical protein PVAND_010537 [Polypedilum vanderplanki]|uniref:Chitin-binding type-2 domain-containing protein n=1 Tax=Polypedilum vanderplanki TaxID=319348 RepID=A0A9J6CGR5_POLVA|nr:hypothetical protein PVAND_010537 [Polypedilum vanderplanki]
MEIKTAVILISLLALVNCQDRTPADVCKSDRTKVSFCNDQNNCNATAVILCFGNGLGTTIPCANSQPYCIVSDKGDSCTSTNPCSSSSSNGGATSLFQCTSVGYYPNPLNCSQYFFCSTNENKTEFVPTLYNCPNGNVFSPSTGSYCTRYNSWLNNCKTVNCQNATQNVTQKYIQISYGFNSQYYALCIAGNDPTYPLIFVCPANTVPNLNSFPAICDYRCWRTGFFENTLDNSKYFECYINNYLRYESIERTCPEGAYFNSTKSECVVKTRSFNAAVNDARRRY